MNICFPLHSKYYYNGEFVEELPSDQKIYSWSFCPKLSDKNIEFVKLYAQSSSIEDKCPKNLKDDFEDSFSRLKSFFSSFEKTGIEPELVGIYNLIPDFALKEFFDVKSEIVKRAVANNKKPINYDFFLDLSRVVYSIEQRELNFDKTAPYVQINDGEGELYDRFLKSISGKNHIKYDIFASDTGRMGLRDGSFPILNMRKEFRSMIKPNNDYFVEFDYNAAELRTFLGLHGAEQPDGDLHTWFGDRFFENCTRKEVKSKVFAWLYDLDKNEPQIEEEFGREGLVEEFWQNGRLNNPFNRTMVCDYDHSISYLTQSTFSDLFLRKVVGVFDLLEDKSSEIALMIHDSLVVDLNSDEKDVIVNVVNEMEKTRFGEFPVSIHIGKNFGEMQEV